MRYKLRYRNWDAGIGQLVLGLLTVLPSAHAGSDDPSVASPALRVTRLVSPDGRREAHGLYLIGPDGEATSKIVVAEADGTGRRALDVKLEGPAEVYWFGNDRLAFSMDVPRPQRRKTQSAPGAQPAGPLYTIVDLEGRTVETIRLPEACVPLYEALSPDGRSVAYCGRLLAREEEKVDYGLFVVDVATGTVRKVLKEPVKTLPAWSPDARKLAIGAAGGYVKDYPLTVIDVATGQAEAVGCNGVGVAWSSDGQGLAFTTEIVRGGSWGSGIPFDGRIGVWDLSRKALTLVSPAGVNISDKESGRWELAGSHHPVWSPDGRRLAYWQSHSINGGRVNQKTDEMWVVNRDGTGARKVLNHEAEVAWLPDGRTLVWLHEGRVGRVDVDAPVTLGPTPSRPIGAFAVTGTIVDAMGRPLPGVAVTIAAGIGTLFPTEPVETDEQGRYTAHFGPGMYKSDAVNLQAAIVHASKPGYYEKDLCRAGNLGMAFKRPEEKPTDPYIAIVYPGHPYRLDFTMLPAARVLGQLVDPEKKPLARFSVCLEGESSPATNVLACETTDEQGRFVKLQPIAADLAIR